jgi:alpha-D-xyloside xylohydrolase
VKFSDGYWQLRSGVSARYPAQVYDVTADSDSLTVYAPTRPIRQRGDTLNQALITVRCSSPAADVLSVSVSHFLGTRARRPEFSVHRDPTVPVRTEMTESEAVITSGALAARFRRGEGWGLEFSRTERCLRPA